MTHEGFGITGKIDIPGIEDIRRGSAFVDLNQQAPFADIGFQRTVCLRPLQIRRGQKRIRRRRVPQIQKNMAQRIPTASTDHVHLTDFQKADGKAVS
ncbi:hypothetical protein SDC9_156490 [bioreactor metagenome]|uniref:Uncharacterized protein n=1 Tax=bioreactor metagenome TaxID=1076179 RepID=A0A645F4K0_9ZZZZ